MTTQLTLADRSGQAFAQHHIADGQTLRIAAQPHTQYRLLDPQSGQAPDYVQLLRQGDDLHILIREDGTLILDNYYAIDPSGTLTPVLGAQADGQWLAYPHNPDIPHLLAGEIATPASHAPPDITPLAGLLGIAAVGGIGAAIAGRRSETPHDNTGFLPDQPQSPFDPNQPAPPAPNPPAPNPPAPNPPAPNPPAPNPPAPNPPAPNPPAPNPPAPNPPAPNPPAPNPPAPNPPAPNPPAPNPPAPNPPAPNPPAPNPPAPNPPAPNPPAPNPPAPNPPAPNPPAPNPPAPNPPVNHAPTGTVTISGTAEIGKTLTAGNTLDDADGLGQITYKWFADGAEVGQGGTYTVQPADKGKTITVKAEYTDGKGYAESVESAATAPVDDAYLLREDFSGYAIGSDYSAEGGTFGPWKTVFHGNGHVKIIDRGNGNHALELAPAAIATDQSKTAATLVVGPDTGSHFEYSGTFTTSEQLRTNDAPNAWETSWIVWGYQDPEHFYYFIPKVDGWELGKRDPAYKGGLNNVGGQRFLATGSEPVLTPESLKHFTVTQNGNIMRISINGRDIVTFEDNESPYTGGKIGIYTEDARINADDLTLKHIAPNTLPLNMHDGQVTLSGEAKVGATLTAIVVDADDIPPDSIHYIWYADKARIAGADGATFIISREHLGKHISVQAMYTDRAGTSEAPVSTATAAIVDSFVPPPATNSPPTGNVSITGETQVGKTLTASNTLKDEDGLGTITYKWYADGVHIGTGNAYTLTAAEKGKAITVKAEYTDGKGHAESVESNPTQAVTDPIAPPFDGAPTIRLSGATEVTEGSSATYRVDLDLSAIGKPANPADLLDKLANTSNILFGHQHGLDVGIAPPNAAGFTSDVYAMTGRYPAVIGLDAAEWPVDRTKTPQENGKALAECLKDIDNVGGIATLSAHWHNPASGGESHDKTPVALNRILPGGDLHGKYAAYLDTIAEIAQASVRADGSKIPIIFRPLHENTGDWFWWGKQNFSAEEFKTLWQYSVDYLRGKGADNLLYAFSPNGHFDGDAGRYLETYPGDGYVDVFGYDVYLNSLAQDRSKWVADTVQDLAMLTRLAASHGKVAAFSEFGMNGEYTLKPSGNPYPTFYTDLLKAIKADPDAAKIAYMLTWANFGGNGSDFQSYTPWPGHEMEGDFKAFAQALLLGKAADRDIIVELEIIHGTTDDGDLKIGTHTLTIPKGHAGADFTIDALADGKSEGDESYRVKIKNAQGAVIGQDSVATVIHDDGATPPPPADTTPPTVQISAGKASLNAGESTTLTFTLSEAVKDFDASDISVSSGALSAFTKVNDTTYTATYTAGAAAGSAAISIAANAFSDLADNHNTAGANLDLTVNAAPNPNPSDMNDPIVRLKGSAEITEGGRAEYTIQLDNAALPRANSAAELQKLLHDNPNILFGQQRGLDVSFSPPNAEGHHSDVYALTHHYPAVIGMAMMEPPMERGLSAEENGKRMAQALLKIDAVGGIPSVSAHWDNPMPGPGGERDFSQVDLKRLLPGGDLNGTLNEWLDTIAAMANHAVREDGTRVPFLLRPLHEANGEWAWWYYERGGAETYKELYRYVVKYVKDHGADGQMLSIFAPNGGFDGDESRYLQLYPGDEAVDVLAVDSYDIDNNLLAKDKWLDGLVKDLGMLSRMAESRGKIAVLAEFGREGDKVLKPEDNRDPTWYTDLIAAIKADPDAAKIAYMMTWANFGGTPVFSSFTPWPGHEMAEDFKKFAEQLQLVRNADSDIIVELEIIHGSTDDGDLKTGTKEIVIPKGKNSATFIVEALADGKTEGDENYRVKIKSVRGANLDSTHDSVETVIHDNTAANQPGTVAISGEAKIGATLDAGIHDADGVPQSGIQYQWLRDGAPIANATGKTYTLTAADAGKKISVRAEYQDNAKHPENLTSGALDIPAAVNHAPTGAVTITGEGKVGQTLTASHSIKDEDGLGKITYKWYVGGWQEGEGETYTVRPGDKGKGVSVKAEYTDGKGNAESVASQPLIIGEDSVPPQPPANNQAPTAPQLSHDTGKSFWVTAGQSGAAIGKVSATDADGDAITYHVSDNRFEIAGDTLKLKDGQSVDYANEKRIILTLVARDVHGAEASRDIAVQVKAEGAYRSDNPHAFSFPVLADGELPVVPHAPQIARAADGSVVITPDANADTLHLRYQDATGKTHLVDLAWNRYEQRWYSSDTAIRPQESVRAVTLPADRLKPGSNVFASNAAKGIYADDSAELVGTGETPAALEAYLYAANRSAVTEGHAAHYLVRLNRAATEDLTFNIALTHKDSDGSDAALATQSVTIRAGERHAAFAVELADDNHAEGTETYKIAISSASGQVRIPASRASLSGEIRDNDQPQPVVDHDDHNLYLTPASSADSMTFSYHDRDYGAVTLNTWRDAGGTWHISELNPDKRATVPAIDAQSGKVSIPFAIVSELGSISAHHDHIMESGSGRNTAIPDYQGWTLDWRDTFSEDLSAQNWTAYGWGWQAPEFGGMGRYYQSNAFTADGALHLRSQYHDGEWSSTGVSGSDAFSAVGGRWEVRARFPDAKGIGYAFLLWPKSENWPPEVDFAEGRVRDPDIMATYHWGSVDNHMQDNRYLQNEDLTDWHTYGAIVDPAAQTITYTFDGQPWFTLKDVPVTDEALWIGFQTGAQDPLGTFAQYESIDHAIPGKDTPAVSDIEIDWVAHYRPSGAPKTLAPPQLNLDYATAAGDSGENTAAPLTVGDVLTDSDTLALDNLLGAPANSPPPPISPSVADSAPPLPAGDPIRWIDIQNGTEIL